MQPLVIKIICQRSCNEKHGSINRKEMIDAQGYRGHKTYGKENKQHRRKKDNLKIAVRCAIHLFTRKKVMVLHGMALKHRLQDFIAMVHWVTMPDVFKQVGVKKGKRHNKPLFQRGVMNVKRTSNYPA